MRDDRIALVSIWPPSKILYYDRDGQYLDTWQLKGLPEFHRFVCSLNGSYILGSDFTVDKNGDSNFEFFITALDAAGLPRNRQTAKKATLQRYEPGRVVHEENLWIIPRIEPGPNGTLLVQPDVFAPNVDVYDRDLRMVARIAGGWTPPLQAESVKQTMLEQTGGAKIAAETERALPHLWAFADREIWLQKPAEGAEPVFAAYDLAGCSLGDVRIAGIDGGVEHMVLHEGLLLTFAECEDGTGAIARQAFRLYRLGI